MQSAGPGEPAKGSSAEVPHHSNPRFDSSAVQDVALRLNKDAAIAATFIPTLIFNPCQYLIVGAVPGSTYRMFNHTAFSWVFFGEPVATNQGLRKKYAY